MNIRRLFHNGHIDKKKNCRYMFVQGLELSAVRQQHKFTCLHREWNCLQYGNSTNLHACTGNGTVCSTVTAKIYMFAQGMELSAIR